MSKRLPVTLVTGFLGSGKTTLLRHLLTQSNQRLAVMINEFGSVGIDGDLIKSCGFCPDDQIEGRVVELNNGCLCCTVQDDFLPTMEILLSNSDNLDGIIIETSGLALPLPLIQALEWPEVKSNIFLNGVVTLVDGEALSLGSPVGDLLSLEQQRVDDQSLDHLSTVEELFGHQLESADLVLITRADILSSTTVERIQSEIHNQVKPGTVVLPLSQGQIEPSIVLGAINSNSFDLERTLDGNHPNQHHGNDHEHNHLDVVSTSYKSEAEFDLDEFKRKLVLLSSSHKILRVKGRLWLKGKALPLQLQMVGRRISSWFEHAPLNAWKPTTSGVDLIVLSIGLNIEEALDDFFQPK